ncbi:unnamed protein product [marine sediment metagenome]|uniref:Uncharacterized protein n=1 Tax=marine sediment metagenome TaxID=412755 RepID=X1KSN0_9ZZZZ
MEPGRIFFEQTKMRPQPFLELLKKYKGQIYNATQKEIAQAMKKSGSKNHKELLEILNIAEALYQKEKSS